MKLFFLALFLATAAFGQTLVSPIVHNSSACLSMTTCASAAITVSTGNLLAVGVTYGTTSMLPTVNDTGSANTFTAQTEFGDSSHGFMRWFIAKNAVAVSGDVITASFGGTTQGRVNIVVRQYSGADTTTPVDQVTGSVAAAPGLTYTSPAFTTTSANEALLLLAAADGNLTSFTAGTGYGNLDQSADGFTASEDKFVTSIQPGVTATINAPSGTSAVVGAVVTIKAAVSTGLSPSTLTFTMASVPGPGFTAAYAIPYRKSTAVPGSGTPSIGACGSNTGPSNICISGVHASATANTVWVYFEGQAQQFLVGTSSAQFTVTLAGGGCSGGCTLTVTVNVVASNTTRVFQTPKGTTTNCTTTGYPWLIPEICTVTNPLPGGTLPSPFPSALGAKYTDENFGGSAIRLTAQNVTRVLGADSINSALNAGATLGSLSNPVGGAAFLTHTDGSGDQCSPSNSLVASFQFDPVDPNAYYFLPQVAQGTGVALVKKNTPCGSSPTTVVTYSGVADYLSASSDGMPSREGLWALEVNPSTLGNDPVFMVVNVNTNQILATWNYQTNPIPAFGSNYLPGQANHLRGEITNAKEVSTINGKLWFIVTVYPGTQGNEFFSYCVVSALCGANVITDEGPEPFSAEAAFQSGGANLKIQPTVSADCAGGQCPSAGHADFVTILVNGVHHQAYASGLYGLSAGPTTTWFAAADLENPGGIAKMKVAPEDGGGLYGVMPVSRGNEGHTGSAYLPYSIWGYEDALTTYNITGITTGSTTTITVASTSGLSIGNNLLMNLEVGVPELAGVNTVCTVAAPLTGTTFVCNGLTTSGTWSSGGSFVINTTPANDQYLNELLAFDFSNLPGTVTINRLIKTRTWNTNDPPCQNFWCQNHPSISGDGTKFAFTTNEGIPGRMGVWFGPTGMSASASATAPMATSPQAVR